MYMISRLNDSTMQILSKSVRQTLAVALTFFSLFALTSSALAAGPGPGGIKHSANMQRPVVVGAVASISGTTLTVNSKAMERGDWRKNASSTPSSNALTSYIVNAANATVTKNGATSTVSAIAVGDTVMVEGTLSGTNVTATEIRDGMMGRGTPGSFGGKPGVGRASSTPTITGNGQPVVGGNVTAVNGNSLTVTNKSSVTYTVDATSAKVSKQGATGATVASIVVGDSVIVQGTVSGTSVTASSVIDNGMPPTATSGATTGSPAPRGGGFMGAIGGFFSHLFGFF